MYVLHMTEYVRWPMFFSHSDRFDENNWFNFHIQPKRFHLTFTHINNWLNVEWAKEGEEKKNRKWWILFLLFVICIHRFGSSFSAVNAKHTVFCTVQIWCESISGCYCVPVSLAIHFDWLLFCILFESIWICLFIIFSSIFVPCRKAHISQHKCKKYPTEAYFTGWK